MRQSQSRFGRFFKKVIAAVDSRSPDERFRDDALPHLPAVARFAVSLTRDEADADDLVQETFLRAFRAWDQFVPGTECRAWLFTICRNTYLRTKSREQVVAACDDPELEALAAAAIHTSAQEQRLEGVWDRVDVMPAVERAIAELPDAFREVVVLVDLEEQSYEDASRVLNVPIGTVRSRLFRGRRLLQERLINYARDAGIVTGGDVAKERKNADEA